MTNDALIEEALALYDLAHDANLSITAQVNLMAGRLRELINSALPADPTKVPDGSETLPVAAPPALSPAAPGGRFSEMEDA